MLELRFFSEAGPDGGLLWLLWWVFGFFFLMVVVGWLASRNNGSRLDARQEVHEHPHEDADDLVNGETKSPKLKGRRRK